MNLLRKYDVIIIGGGLAGLTLSIQLKQKNPNLSILVLEKAAHPPREAAFKVGESTVEVAARYFKDTLGLHELLKETELPKLGLRFFFPHKDQTDISKRVEVGLSDFMPTPSFQIDRGRLEKNLALVAQEHGVEFWDQSPVRDFTLGKMDHQVVVERIATGVTETLQCTWVVDASSRPGLFKQKMGLKKKVEHSINSVWFRIPARIDLTQWSNDKDWQNKTKKPRWYSTNHLMGTGYWVWIIPLSSGSTSVGIVADERIHPIRSMNSAQKALDWLQVHEPQCRKELEPFEDKFQDFLMLKHFSHSCKKVFSEDGWYITGEAGLFLDPFYSPGSDFISISNGFVTNLITGNPEDAMQAERHYKGFFLGYYNIYFEQYAIMGNPLVMPIKVLWDIFCYWSIISLLCYNDKLSDIKFLDQIAPELDEFFALNREVQEFLLEFSNHTQDVQLKEHFVDYHSSPLHLEKNKDLLNPMGDDELKAKLQSNLNEIKRFGDEVRYFASQATHLLPACKKPEGEFQFIDSFMPLLDQVKEVI